MALQLGRANDAGTMDLHQISMAKLDNVRVAIEIARECRTILGGNGITGEYSPLRHANNLESVRTYEGTDEMHTLDRKSTRLNSSHVAISYAVFCLKKTRAIKIY